MNDPAKAQAHDALLLRQALLRNEIIPCFQPIITLRSGRLAGFEVLARWPHSGASQPAPAEFIALAEQLGLIDQLTDRLVLAACAEAAAWPDEIFLSFNLSPHSLRDHSLAERLHAIAQRTGFPTTRITCEITEGALIENPPLALEVIGELRALGIKVAHDDFGTGYSSLRQLQSLPCDTLKIDASFIRSMTYHRPSRKIVAAVIGLGQSLGLSIVAEGVETQQQADMLAGLGCDLGQGWWLGRPVAAAEASHGVVTGQWNRPGVDLTARVASDMALRLEASPSQRLAQLGALYDGAPVGLALLDSQLRYLSLNRRLAEMHGAPVEAHIGRSLGSIAPDLFRTLAPYLNRVFHGEPVHDLRVSWSPPGTPGEPRVYAASYHPVRGEHDEIVGISVAVIEITDRGEAAPAPASEATVPPVADGEDRLTTRQLDVMRLLAEGRPIKEIARRLDLSVGTVKVHLARAYRVLGARNRIEAITRLRPETQQAAEVALTSRAPREAISGNAEQPANAPRAWARTVDA